MVEYVSNMPSLVPHKPGRVQGNWRSKDMRDRSSGSFLATQRFR